MKKLEQYIESYDDITLMLCDENDSNYINEAEVNKIKPFGYIDNFNYNDKKYEQHRLTLLNNIANSTSIEDNNDANGDIVFNYYFDLKNKSLYKCKKVIKGKTTNDFKEPKIISSEKITNNEEKIYEILFGYQYKTNDFSTLEKLVDFICSKEYKNSNKETIKYIFDQFLTSCNEQKLKTYGLKTYLQQKLQTII